jgi:hypothetical protein
MLWWRASYYNEEGSCGSLSFERMDLRCTKETSAVSLAEAGWRGEVATPGEIRGPVALAIPGATARLHLRSGGPYRSPLKARYMTER